MTDKTDENEEFECLAIWVVEDMCIEIGRAGPEFTIKIYRDGGIGFGSGVNKLPYDDGEKSIFQRTIDGVDVEVRQKGDVYDVFCYTDEAVMCMAPIKRSKGPDIVNGGPLGLLDSFGASERGKPFGVPVERHTRHDVTHQSFAPFELYSSMKLDE